MMDNGGKDRRQIPLPKNRLVWAGLAIATAAVLLGGYLWISSRGPEEAVSSYLSALSSGDYDTAFQALTNDSRRAVGNPENLRQTSLGALFSQGIVDSYRVEKARQEAKKTVVEVVFTNGSQSFSVSVVTKKEGGAWRIEI
jgi:hypothetical protein